MWNFFIWIEIWKNNVFEFDFAELYLYLIPKCVNPTLVPGDCGDDYDDSRCDDVTGVVDWTDCHVDFRYKSYCLCDDDDVDNDDDDDDDDSNDDDKYDNIKVRYDKNGDEFVDDTDDLQLLVFLPYVNTTSHSK